MFFSVNLSWSLVDPNPNNLTLALTLTLTLTLALTLTLTLTLNNINEWENALKTKNNNFKKQIKKTRKTKLSLQLFLMPSFDRVNGPMDMRVWKGRRFENILKLDHDLG
jgi:hypothetical protein